MTANRSFDEILSTADAANADGGQPPARMDPTLALAELAKIDLRTADLSSVLQRVAELAQKSLPGVDEASVSLLDSTGAAQTPAYTGQLALEADESQYANDNGPCLDAARGGGVQVVEDMATEQRWPGYVPRARKAGVASSLSVPLPVQETITGGLNLYSRSPRAFDEHTVELAQTFAGYAAVAVANAQLYETTAALARQMQDAMDSRAVIEQAKGLVMGQRRCTSEEAFQVLVQASSRSNRKLRDVAAELIATTHRQ